MLILYKLFQKTEAGGCFNYREKPEPPPHPPGMHQRLDRQVPKVSEGFWLQCSLSEPEGNEKSTFEISRGAPK